MPFLSDHPSIRRVDARLPPVLRFAGVAAWIGLAVLSLVSGDERPHTGYSGNLEHFTAYAMAATAAGLGFAKLRRWAGLALFVVSAGLFELAQIWIPGRHAGIDNWAASSAGAAAGLMIAWAALAVRRSWLRLG